VGETLAPKDKEAVPVLVMVMVGLAVIEGEGVIAPLFVVVMVILVEPEGVVEAVWLAV
jgi:hypothetical protein